MARNRILGTTTRISVPTDRDDFVLKDRIDGDHVKRAPFTVAAVTVLAPLVFAAQLGLDPDPFADGPATALTAGLVVFALIAVTGLLLSRGRWSRNLSIGLSISQIGLFVSIGFKPLSTTAAFLAALSITSLTGPWLTGWIRLRPAADGPDPRAVSLAIGTIALLPGTALASPAGFTWQHILFVIVAPVMALAYSQASIAALWVLRLGLMPFSVIAISASPLIGASYLAVHVIVLTVIAWSKETMLAVRPLLERSLGPRSARPPTSLEKSKR